MNVAIVEDTDDVATMLRLSLTLSHPGLEAHVASTAADGYLLDWPAMDAALIDHNMQVGTTDDLVRWVTTQHPHVNVLILTADPPDLLPLDLRHLHVGKPIEFDELSHRLGIQ